MPRGVPRTASMLEVAEECRLLGIDSNAGLAAALTGLYPGLERLAWRVAVQGMAPARVLRVPWKRSSAAWSNALTSWGLTWGPCVVRSAASWRTLLPVQRSGDVWVASGRGLDQGFQIVQQRRVVHGALLAPAPRPSDPLVTPPRYGHGAGVDLRHTSRDRRA